MKSIEDEELDTADETFAIERLPGSSVGRRADSVPAPVDPASGSLGGPSSLERYLLRRLLGKGAMGEVHLCRDSRIGRDVAMKIILPTNQSDAQARARFVREARVQGQLEHPAIVPVYDLGIDPGGSVFFTMKCLRGMTLAQVIRSLRHNEREVVQHYPRRRLLAAFASACLAIDFAHSRGVVHRDIKPSNIMLGDFGEVYVLDWGIAKLRETDSNGGLAVQDALEEDVLTAADKILGTFGYMAPEQAIGRSGQLDARCDVYSLGAILFELLTLEPLHPKSTWNAMLHSTLHGANAQTSVRAPGKDVPPELEAICVKATKLHPEERFASARELHDAVERFLDGDRDVERRHQMALRYARAAEEAAGKAVGGGPGSEDARRDALREVARALALDPTNAEAMAALGRIVTAPPSSVPSEVVSEMAAATAARRKLQLKEGVRANLLGTCLLVPFALWMGVRSVLLLVVTAVLTLAAGGVQLIAARAEGTRPTDGLVYGAYLLNVLALLCISRAFGPLFFMPMILALLTFAYCMSHEARFRWAVIVTGAGALVASIALELAGVLPPSYAFQDGALTILPNAVTLPRVPTLTGLAVASFVLAVAPGVVMGRLQSALNEAEQRSFLHVWHLRQLLPDSARTPAADHRQTLSSAGAE